MGSEKTLIEYWKEIGKVRTTSSKISFVLDTGIHLSYTGSWNTFFQLFDFHNHEYFLGNTEQCFDIWNPNVFGLEIFFNKMFPGEGLKKQQYEIIEKL